MRTRDIRRRNSFLDDKNFTSESKLSLEQFDEIAEEVVTLKII